jgi:hypothetical protein
MTTRTLDLDSIHIGRGKHSAGSSEPCFMEAAAYIAGEPWTDAPACVCPILAAYSRALNDVLPDGKRQSLKPYIPQVIGTADDGLGQARGLMATDWIIRVYTPTWLRLAGLSYQAAALEALPRQATWGDVEAALPVLRAAKGEAAATRDAARAAARAATWAAARAATRDAAGDAAWAAARAATGDAAWAATRAAAWAAAGDAAWAAAWAATVDAAGAAAGAAARAAARAALQPTVDHLQDSAIALLGRMVTCNG